MRVGKLNHVKSMGYQTNHLGLFFIFHLFECYVNLKLGQT